MNHISSHVAAAIASLTAALIALGCGGRVSEDSDQNTDTDDNGGVIVAPAPTCAAVCRHVVDSCVPGGDIAQCARDCESMRSEVLGCKALDVFLRCMPTVPVLCGDEIKIDGCYEERNEVARCPKR
ncbi:MAG TPA: hypothetical protein VK550_26405 [Polyangiaceae bacterium]|nr:hypothetical protein [Polyangiaceae bacterium]